MKKIIFIAHILFGVLTFAQEIESTHYYETAYYELLDYVPKNFTPDTIFTPNKEVLKVELNTIGTLRLFHLTKKQLNLSKNDNNWLENRIAHMATALFHDGKRILITAVNNYSGKMIDTIWLDNIEITELKFGHNCTDADQDRDFIKIFNDKMYSLMKIEPPNRKTSSFYGEYTGKAKNKAKTRLILEADRTFRFWLNKGHGSDFTEGLWKNKNDTLILNSKTLNKNDSIRFILSSAKWIEFDDLEFRLKRQKLKELSHRNWKLKKSYQE